MALTADQARLAGQLQTQIDLLTTYVGNLQTAVNNGGTIEWAAVRMGVAGEPIQMETPLQMNASDSAAVLNALIQVYQANINNMQSQIAAIGT